MTAVLSSASFPLRCSNVAVSLAIALLADQASAAAGRVDFATDGATVSASNGQQRPLARGVELNSGDTIRTDARARAQIRFADGAYVSLQPDTEFSIKDYNFDGKADGSERGFFALAKGTMRTVTGLIGRINKNRYQISTPTATIGIRGTGGRIEVLLDGSTLIAGTSGIWVLSNPSGTIDVPAGTFGKAPSAPNQPPQRTLQGPNTGPAPLPVDPPKALEPKQAENRTPNGTSAVLVAPIVPLASGSGYASAVAYTPNSGGSAAGKSDLDAVFTSSGQLTNIQNATPSFGFGFNLVNGSHAEFGTDGILAWGRWIGSVNQNCDCINPQMYGSNQGLHYVVGMPTAVMPTTGTGTYAVMGSTSPTYSNGGGLGTFTGSLSVMFGATTTVTANLNIAMSDGKGYAMTDTMTTRTALFSSTQPTIAGSGGACGQGCSGSIQGFFAGASAERAGVAYSVTDFTTSTAVNGAAAFRKAGP
jgi:hypothetical protein